LVFEDISEAATNGWFRSGAAGLLAHLAGFFQQKMAEFRVFLPQSMSYKMWIS
jgi:hypothetical protein